jgi:hypothetical protein
VSEPSDISLVLEERRVSRERENNLQVWFMCVVDADEEK